MAHAIREDGAFVEAGENDNLIVQKLKANPNAVGIFGFSFLDQNSDKIKGADRRRRADVREHRRRRLWHLPLAVLLRQARSTSASVPGIEDYLAEFTSEKAWGPDGYLVDKGLIPLPGRTTERAMRYSTMNKSPT